MNYRHLLAACLAAVTLSSCHSDDDGPASRTPVYLLEGTDARPTTWEAPDYSLFELTMSVQVQLGDTLASLQSTQDLMCATINGDVRAVTGSKTTMGEVYFPLTIAGNGGEKTVTLMYYCDRLHRIYTLTNWTNFNASAAPTGESGLYRPCFTSIFQ
ncbi:MAG: hypothetical protein IJ722_07750 [Alloprevotella sp.]|nr:hypothetical protein [Alloprevotella sp.]